MKPEESWTEPACPLIHRLMERDGFTWVPHPTDPNRGRWESAWIDGINRILSGGDDHAR